MPIKKYTSTTTKSRLETTYADFTFITTDEKRKGLDPLCVLQRVGDIEGVGDMI